MTAEEDAKEKYAIASAIAKRLVAYVVADRIPGATINELRDFSQTRLPGYMVPFVFMFLDSLPPNINGNVDRKALPAMDANRSDVERNYLAPRTSAERTIVGIWSAVLRIDRVGVRNNFFELGGHSLSATQFVAQLHNEFGVDVPFRALSERPIDRSLV